MPGSEPTHEREHQDDLLDGISESAGVDAVRAARRDERQAQRGESPDPLADVAARIVSERRPDLAFDNLVLDAALKVQLSDPAAFEELLHELRAAKVRVTAWLAALSALRRRRREEARVEERQQRRAATSERREAHVRALAEKRAEREAARGEADSDRVEHFRERMLDDVTYAMEPGRLSMERVLHGGTDRERTVQSTLARFSAVLLEVVLDVDTPDAKARPSLYVLSVVRGAEEPRRVEVPAEEWARTEWPEQYIPSPGVGPGGRATREHLRAAIETLSTPATHYRFRFVGWTRYETRSVYLHAGGAIDAHGDVQGLRAEPSVARCARFALPLLSSFDAARDVGALVYLFDHEPASVVVPLVGLAIRAAMGDARSAIHVTGRTGLGKSVLVGVIAQLFGPSFSARNPLLSWRGRGATVQGILEMLACARDVYVQIDDLQRTPESMAKATAVLPAHFEGVAQIKGRRTGGSLSGVPSQGVIGSSGETLPDDPNVRNRVYLVDLDEHPSPRLDVGDDCIKARGDRGELARATARFIQWWAARYDQSRPHLAQMERDAAEAWGLGVDARAAEVLGAPALGLDMLFSFLSDLGANPSEIQSMRKRAQTALLTATEVHVEHVEEEASWRRFLELVREALLSGKGHCVHARREGRSLLFEHPPTPTIWGWRRRRTHTTSSDSERETESQSITYVEQGPTIAYSHADRPDKVLISPGPALRVALQLARDSGRPLHLDVNALARDLVAAGVLTHVSKGRATGRCKWSWGNRDLDGFEVSVATLGLVASETPPTSATVSADPGDNNGDEP